MDVPDSLARGVAPAPPGTLHARSVNGGVEMPPRPGLTVRFGRGSGPTWICASGRTTCG
ncbi:hypothetical protein ACFQQB_02555 [Nonomuraea rubra]|uniref:hypothetical protein n=1 Tax=Nonomuraea rubra TaxID=46180 RepID=UPI00361A2B88